jgi:hypothetical protein
MDKKKSSIGLSLEQLQLIVDKITSRLGYKVVGETAEDNRKTLTKVCAQLIQQTLNMEKKTSGGRTTKC